MFIFSLFIHKMQHFVHTVLHFDFLFSHKNTKICIKIDLKAIVNCYHYLELIAKRPYSLCLSNGVSYMVTLSFSEDILGASEKITLLNIVTNMALSLTKICNLNNVRFIRKEFMALLYVKNLDRANISELISAPMLSLAFTNHFL